MKRESLPGPERQAALAAPVLLCELSFGACPGPHARTGHGLGRGSASKTLPASSTRLCAEQRPPLIKRPVREGRVIGTDAAKYFKVSCERAKPRRGGGRCATKETRHKRRGS